VECWIAMTSSGTTPPQRALTEERVEGELRELNSRIRFFDVAATIVALGGLAIGALAAIPLGPSPFLAAAIVGVAVALAVKLYTLQRKEHLREEISSLKESGQITANEAIELRTRVNVIYTDNPEKAEEVSRQ
jgi:hypothetical protein